jgi:hypothetical protein
MRAGEARNLLGVHPVAVGLSPPRHCSNTDNSGPFVLAHKLVHTLATISITQ